MEFWTIELIALKLGIPDVSHLNFKLHDEKCYIFTLGGADGSSIPINGKNILNQDKHFQENFGKNKKKTEIEFNYEEASRDFFSFFQVPYQEGKIELDQSR